MRCGISCTPAGSFPYGLNGRRCARTSIYSITGFVFLYVFFILLTDGHRRRNRGARRPHERFHGARDARKYRSRVRANRPGRELRVLPGLSQVVSQFHHDDRTARDLHSSRPVHSGLLETIMGRTVGSLLRISGAHRIVLVFAVASGYALHLSGSLEPAAGGRLEAVLIAAVVALLVVALGAVRLRLVAVGAGASVRSSLCSSCRVRGWPSRSQLSLLPPRSSTSSGRRRSLDAGRWTFSSPQWTVPSFRRSGSCSSPEAGRFLGSYWL